MGNYVFNTEFLFEQLERDSLSTTSDRDFGNNIIPAIIEELNGFRVSPKGITLPDTMYCIYMIGIAQALLCYPTTHRTNIMDSVLVASPLRNKATIW